MGLDINTGLNNIPGGNERILFVDDSKAMIGIFEKMLKRLGYQIITFQNSIRALETFKTAPYVYDLIITDLIMPHMDGIALSKELLALRPEVPIMLLTGSVEQMDLETLESAGIRKVLKKPFKYKVLAEAVRSVIGRPQELDKT